MTLKAASRSAGSAFEPEAGLGADGGASLARLSEPSAYTSTCTTGCSSRTSAKLHARCSSEAMALKRTRSSARLAIGASSASSSARSWISICSEYGLKLSEPIASFRPRSRCT